MALFNSGNSAGYHVQLLSFRTEGETFRGVFEGYYAVLYTPTSSKHVDSY